MPRIEIEKIPAQQIASYPREFAAVISGREKQRIGDAAGLTQFGVNVTRIKVRRSRSHPIRGSLPP